MEESPAAIRFFKFFNHMLRWWPLFRLINSMRFPSSTTRNRFYLMKQLSLRWRFNSSFIRVLFFFTNFMANMCKLLQSDWNRDHSGDRLILMQAISWKIHFFVYVCFFFQGEKCQLQDVYFAWKTNIKRWMVFFEALQCFRALAIVLCPWRFINIILLSIGNDYVYE